MNLISAVALLVALQVSCSGSAPLVAPHARSTAGAAPPPSEPASVPVLVVQAVEVPSYLPGLRNSSKTLSISRDGTLIAAHGPELKLIDAADGAVRAVFEPQVGGQRTPQCTTAAAFTPEDDALIVLGCAEQPGERGSPEALVYRWDLQTDTVTEIGTGPFNSISFTIDGDALILRGDHTVRVQSLADGKERHTLHIDSAPDNEIVMVANTGDRAIAKVGAKTVLLTIGDQVAEIQRKYRQATSPDLRLDARTAKYDKLLIRRLDTAELVTEIKLGKNHQVLGFDPRGRTLAIATNDGDRQTIQLIGRDGERGCAFDLGARRTGHYQTLAWSSDGARIAVELSTPEQSVATFVGRIDGCQFEHHTPPYSGANESLRFNGALHGIGTVAPSYLTRPGDAARPVEERVVVTDPQKQSARSIPIRLASRLTDPGPDGEMNVIGPSEASDHIWRFEPITQTVTRPGPIVAPEIVTAGGTLSVALQDGSVASVRGSVPPGAVGALFFLGAKGKRTPLTASEPYLVSAPGMPENTMFNLCEASPGGTFVACNRADGEGNQMLAIWDAFGRTRVEQTGSSVSFSPDDRRALIMSRVTNAYYLVDTANGTVLKSQASPRGGYDARLSPDGTLVAWQDIGVVDALTGATLSADVFDSWLHGPNLLAVYRSPSLTALDIKDARSNTVVHSFEHDARIEGWSKDGSRFLTRDAVDVFRVRDAKTFAGLVRFGSYHDAFLSDDGRFAFAQGNGAIVAVRVKDGAELFIVPVLEPKERALSYTSDGQYDGGDKALERVRYRVGGIKTGKMVLPSEVAQDGRRPRLAADFFAGESIERQR